MGSGASALAKADDGVDAVLQACREAKDGPLLSVSYTHLRAHETKANLVCRLLLRGTPAGRRRRRRPALWGGWRRCPSRLSF